jgi:hypothetical protein
LGVRRRVVTITLVLLVVGAVTAVLAVNASKVEYRSSIRGQLLLTGGPGPGERFPSEGEVIAINASQESFRSSVSSNGEFLLHLPVGRYTLTGSSPQFGGGRYECFGRQKVRVLKDSVAHQNVSCAMR